MYRPKARDEPSKNLFIKSYLFLFQTIRKDKNYEKRSKRILNCIEGHC